MKLLHYALQVSGLLTLSAASPTRTKDSAPTVIVDSGPVVGSQTLVAGHFVNKFLGIPFAAPPRRFAPPVPPEPWSEPYHATEYFPACLQQFVRNANATRQWFNTPAPPESEDCLGLNVWAPANEEGWTDYSRVRGKAVLFWIYGGGLQFGTGSNLAYDGTSFVANQDVIVVTFNYRTNIFGFPGIPGRPDEETNPGFLDQRLALDWVRRNIVHFGGDPDRITIFGQSAGASSVDAIVTLPPEPVPFQAAIYMSGQISLRAESSDPYAAWRETLNLTGCIEADDAVECVSAVPAQELEDLISANAVSFYAIADDVTLSTTAREDRLNSTPDDSKIARVPVLGGTTSEEGRIYAVAYNDTNAYIASAFPSITPEQTELLLKTFAIGSAGIETTFDQITFIITYYQFQCTWAVVAEDTRKVDIPIWRYYWNASFENLQLFPGSGVYHASDIRPIFGNIGADSTEFEVALSHFAQSTWAEFAKDPYAGPSWAGVPSVGSLGGGVRSNAGSQTGQLLEVVSDAVVDARCAAILPLYGV